MDGTLHISKLGLSHEAYEELRNKGFKTVNDLKRLSSDCGELEKSVQYEVRQKIMVLGIRKAS